MSAEHEWQLRQRAERLARDRHRPLPETSEATRELVHELEVHQIELELQNESLRETEAKLQEARDRYFELYDLAPVAYLTLTAEGRIVAANLTAAMLLGIERGRLLGLNLSRCVAIADANRYNRHLRQVLASGAKLGCEITLALDDGSELPVRLMSQPGVADGREVIRTVLIDRTEIREAQAEIHRGEVELNRTRARFDHVAQSMMDGLLLLDRSGVIQAANSSALQMLGYDERELVGQSVDVLTEGDVSLQADRAVRQSFETTIVSQSGRRIPVLASLSPVRDASGAVESIACVVRDITELRRREELMRLTVEAAPIAMLMVDPNHRIDLINAKTEELFGYSRAELHHEPIEKLVPGDLRDEHRRQRLAYTADPEARVMGRGREIFARRKDGELVPVEIALSPFATPDGPRVLAAVVDLSERRRLEEEVRQAQKMEAIGTLASGVAHDFNNLLMGVIGCANITAAALEPDSPAQLYLEEIKRSAESGAAISRQLLTLSSPRDTVPSVFVFDSIVGDARQMLERLLGEDIAFAVRLGAADTSVRLGPGQLEQVLINLAVNARDAMPRGGSLTIETSTRRVDEPDAPPLPGDYVILTVTDTGSGMDEETRRRIFEPFFTTKGAGRGTGLGLSVVYGIVNRAGGHIEVSSAVGRGSRFEVLLPVSRPPESADVEVDAEAATTQAPGTVLVVEDEQTVRLVTRFYLEQAGYQVLEAGSGPEAIERYRSYPGPLDLLLTDVVLPGASGAEVAQKIGELEPDIAVIYMSAHAREWLVAEGRIDAAARTLQKPFEAGALLAAIREALGEPPARGGAAKKTLLVVEDQPASRLAIAEYLRDRGWEVIAAATASEALEACRQAAGEIAALLVDYSLPDATGDELASQVRALFPAIRVAYTSGIDRADLDPAGPVLLKPLELETLAEALERLLDSQGAGAAVLGGVSLD